MVVYGKIKADIGKILRTLCEQKKVNVIEAEACLDNIHMLVEIPPHLSVSQFMGYLKGKSSLMIFDRHANLKYKYGNRHFWCRGYYVDTVGKNEKRIAEYVRNQLQEDIANDQLTFKEYIDPLQEPVSNKGAAAAAPLFVAPPARIKLTTNPCPMLTVVTGQRGGDINVSSCACAERPPGFSGRCRRLRLNQTAEKTQGISSDDPHAHG